jgi:hypothetical protein
MGCWQDRVCIAKLMVALKSFAKNITATSQTKMEQNTRIIKNLVTFRKSMGLPPDERLCCPVLPVKYAAFLAGTLDNFHRMYQRVAL